MRCSSTITPCVSLGSHFGDEFLIGCSCAWETTSSPRKEIETCRAVLLSSLTLSLSRTLPYLGLDPCLPEHLEDAERTIESVERFDADDRVLVIFSHDVSIHKTLEYFPATANDWKEKNWKSIGRWAFLADLQHVAGGHSKTCGSYYTGKKTEL
ncbi:hypothetical protein B0T25DRAFT_139953 [Lasiosphaeria hispida]|uniref:Uncharacterized protein n=1 Tax=Lasiosphaeria hispida TaxID=260671 RepID=A0AAJ0HL23_9PEZI|nr:hypothetical protein B0T25DRAFT_139953 [Lasiosphaeria hispida]